MKYISVASGIEAATMAWKPLGWKRIAFAEFDGFPSAVLAHYYPETPNYGDMNKFPEWPDAEPDVLVGGTPCQSFSIAGLRKGLDGPRGNLTLIYLEIARRYRPRWLVWENVPGVLSHDDGRTFGTFLGGLAELGYGFAYRVLDAEYFGLAQRRKRVFVVGHLGDWRRAAAVLFERESLSGNPAPSREARQKAASTVTASTGGVIGFAQNQRREVRMMDVAGALAADAGMTQQTYVAERERERERPQAFKIRGGCEGGGKGYLAQEDQAFTLSTGADQHLFTQMRVRRLTPRECERLQGFPDDFTLIPYRGKAASDGPRYKALGNSMAVPVMRWIGERIMAVEGIPA